VPSFHYAKGQAKEKLIENYKKKLSEIPCKYFHRTGRWQYVCPFEESCFYSHNDEHGNRLPCKRPPARRPGRGMALEMIRTEFEEFAQALLSGQPPPGYFDEDFDDEIDDFYDEDDDEFYSDEYDEEWDTDEDWDTDEEESDVSEDSDEEEEEEDSDDDDVHPHHHAYRDPSSDLTILEALRRAGHNVEITEFGTGIIRLSGPPPGWHCHCECDCQNDSDIDDYEEEVD
jgi:hypothetical protein